MTCFIAQNELSALVDDALEAARAAELQSHLAGCTSCSRELHEIRKVRTMLRSMPVHRAPPDFLAKVKAKAQKKSILERVTAAVAPLLELPRPAQAGLALAASVVIAVTVFWNNPNKGIDGLGAAPGFREVAVAKSQRPPSAGEANNEEVASLSVEDRQVERKSERAEKQGTLEGSKNGEATLGLSAAPPPVEADALAESSTADKSRLAKPASANDAPDPNAYRASATPAPSAGRSVVQVPGSQGAGASVSSNAPRDNATRGATGYVAPSEPGLYSSTPSAVAAAATPRAKLDNAKGAPAPAKETLAAASVREEEPSFESSADAAPSQSGGDDWGGGDADMGAVSQPVSADEKLTTKDSTPGKKIEARRDREKVAQESSGAGRAAGMETETAVGGVAHSAPVVAAAGPAATQLSAKYLSAAVSAPNDVIEAAKTLGGRVVSPAGSAPGLGKAGASTVVIVEIPAASVAAFEEKLRAGGTLERGTLPSGTVRYRIEVVRQ